MNFEEYFRWLDDFEDQAFNSQNQEICRVERDSDGERVFLIDGKKVKNLRDYLTKRNSDSEDRIDMIYIKSFDELQHDVKQ